MAENTQINPKFLEVLANQAPDVEGIEVRINGLKVTGVKVRRAKGYTSRLAKRKIENAVAAALDPRAELGRSDPDDVTAASIDAAIAAEKAIHKAALEEANRASEKLEISLEQAEVQLVASDQTLERMNRYLARSA